MSIEDVIIQHEFRWYIKELSPSRTGNFQFGVGNYWVNVLTVLRVIFEGT